MGHVAAARPFPYAFDPALMALIVIDMQRDFLEPGGFGAALGNDVARLQAIVPATRRLLDAARGAGLLVVHTRECHASDLSDCPPAKRLRGAPSLRIGDPGPMGRILIRGEPGAEIVAELAALPGEAVIDKPGKGAFYATGLGDLLAGRQISHLILAGSPPRCACRPRCGRPMIVVMNACWPRMRPRAIFPNSRRQRWT